MAYLIAKDNRQVQIENFLLYCFPLIKDIILDTGENSIHLDFNFDDLTHIKKLTQALDKEKFIKLKFIYFNYLPTTFFEYSITLDVSKLLDLAYIANYIGSNGLLEFILMDIANRIKYMIRIDLFSHKEDSTIEDIKTVRSLFGFNDILSQEEYLEIIDKIRVPKRNLELLQLNILHYAIHIGPMNPLNQQITIICDVIKQLALDFLYPEEAVIFLNLDPSLSKCLTESDWFTLNHKSVLTR